MGQPLGQIIAFCYKKKRSSFHCFVFFIYLYGCLGLKTPPLAGEVEVSACRRRGANKRKNNIIPFDLSGHSPLLYQVGELLLSIFAFLCAPVCAPLIILTF